MTISDLLDKNPRGIFASDKILKGELVALDAYDGKILFDTSRNKRETVEKYKKGEVIALWSDVKLCRGIGFGDYFKPVMKCYVSHESWEVDDAE